MKIKPLTLIVDSELWHSFKVVVAAVVEMVREKVEKNKDAQRLFNMKKEKNWRINNDN